LIDNLSELWLAFESKVINKQTKQTDDLNTLINMGFTDKQARDALARQGNDVNKAVEFLLGGGVASQEVIEITADNVPKQNNDANNVITPTAPVEEKQSEESKVQELIGMGFSETQAKKALSRAHSFGTALDLLVSGVDLDDIKLESEAPKPKFVSFYVFPTLTD